MLKRTIALLCALILCLGLFASCGGEKDISSEEKKETNTFLKAPQLSADYQPTYEISVADVSDGLGISGGISYKFKQKNFDDFKPPQTVKITLDGKEMTVSGGVNPSYRFKQYYPVYNYSVPGTEIDIKMDPYGNVLEYEVDDFVSAESAPIMTDEEYERIALDFLASFIDISELEITLSRVSTNLDGYVVHFAQYVNGMKTSGHGEIVVAYDGQVESYVAYDINLISKDTVNPFDMEEVKAKVEAYTAEITENKEKEYDEVNCTYDYQLTMLADGNLAIYCEVEVKCITYYVDEYSVRSGLLELVIQ